MHTFAVEDSKMSSLCGSGHYIVCRSEECYGTQSVVLDKMFTHT